MTLRSEFDLLRSRCVALEEDLQRNDDIYNNNLLIAKEQGRQAADEEFM